ncbi:hypothetical protein [Amycolatopsis dendrobii]|uniref:Uncharacterized protein n=1 Tax=Amycolatopsis dendrobii TaxID=2760662 RepID=A0A7W3VX09_9PSEU|nr:hypothetical protein [Amycolatopsis dendrobii]MBB1154670.1 hypothetical protein [Amycolatopsis dendrobii]
MIAFLSQGTVEDSLIADESAHAAPETVTGISVIADASSQERGIQVKRVFASLAIGLIALFSFLVLPSTASADSRLSASETSAGQSISSRPGCDLASPPPPRFIRVKNGTYYDNAQRTACQQCDDNALTWARQGFKTYCWEIAATAAELWIGPVMASAKNGAVEQASTKIAAKKDPWIIFDHYPTQEACEADRAAGVNKQLWTWESAICATNDVEWVLLIDNPRAPAKAV